MNTSSGASREREISYPTGTPLLGGRRPRAARPGSGTASASRRPASLRSSNGGKLKILIISVEAPPERREGLAALLDVPHPTRILPVRAPQSPAWCWRRSRSGRRGCSLPRGRTQGRGPTSRERSEIRAAKRPKESLPSAMPPRRSSAWASKPAEIRITSARIPRTGRKPRRKRPHRCLPSSRHSAARSP